MRASALYFVSSGVRGTRTPFRSAPFLWANRLSLHLWTYLSIDYFGGSAMEKHLSQDTNIMWPRLLNIFTLNFQKNVSSLCHSRLADLQLLEKSMRCRQKRVFSVFNIQVSSCRRIPASFEILNQDLLDLGNLIFLCLCKTEK